MPVSTVVPALSDLAERMRELDLTRRRWAAAHAGVESWVDGAVLRAVLRRHLVDLDQRRAAALVARSRETTTHFAWCLRDNDDEPFTFWLHEYKPQRDWRPGYADSVHNHRYHFCTAILRGGYRHERFSTTLDPGTGLIAAATRTHTHDCVVGESGFLMAEEFHRIPWAVDGTMTFLVKSRPVSRWSLSYDPATGVGHRHVPVEARLEELTRRI
ncbi:hypothetical protein [Actinokineospora sp. NBRC 105648]|uniref:hypothetical protein n=1 Tax=Actinokineospora sp. NBRC 105648 TaxID=3032206 RepID=UPI0024A37802|nr:hypothetical protein [Actinokineospora sp. NBRC 105648]GLZ36970.1 hypothetical protein Acsp05_05950 [Actinokineospora sp. NBRC 105648]